MNLHGSLTGKEMKIPEEHDWVCIQQETFKLKTLSCNQDSLSAPTNNPSDGETTRDKTNGSNQKGGKTLPDGGKQAAQVSKNQKGPRPNSGSSGTGSGGDDGDDDRKRNVTADKPSHDDDDDGDDDDDDDDDDDEEKRSLPQRSPGM